MRIAKRDKYYCIELTERELNAISLIMFEFTGAAGPAYRDEKRVTTTFNTLLKKAREKWEQQKVK